MYVRIVDDQVLRFRVSGKLWMRSLVMSDPETGTEWSHLLGEAMKGPLKGKTLKAIPSDMLTWAAWRKLHPKTTVMDLRRTARGFTSEFYRDAERFVCGLIANGKPFALPLTMLKKNPVHTFVANDLTLVSVYDKNSTVVRIFETRVDGKPLTFKALSAGKMQDVETESTWDLRSGKAIDGSMKGKQLSQHVAIMSFRRAWMNFHPDSADIVPQRD